MPHSQIHMVRINARVGSPRLDETAKGWMNGMMPSFAIALKYFKHIMTEHLVIPFPLPPTWSKRGAPVKLWRPAPRVERKDPIRITHSLGQAMLATTNFPPIDWPNLIAEINCVYFVIAMNVKLKRAIWFYLLVTQQQIVDSASEKKNAGEVNRAGRQDGTNCSDRNTFLCVRQVARAIRSSHDSSNGGEEDSD